MKAIKNSGESLEEGPQLLSSGINPDVNHRCKSEILSRKDLSKLFGVSFVTIHDWVHRGLLKPYKMGNRTFFRRTEVMEKLWSSNKSA